MDKKSELSETVKRFFLSKLYEYIREDRSQSIHVTDILYGCPRRAYYSKLYPEISEAKMDEGSIITLAVGKKLHEIPIASVDMEEYSIKSRADLEIIREALALELDMMDPEKPFGFHELPVAYFRPDEDEPLVVGRLDELLWLPGYGWVLLDKKTTASGVPSRGPYEHHIVQVMLYAYLVRENYGIEPDYVGIIYIDFNNRVVGVYTDEYQPNDELYLRLLETAKVIKDALETGKPPEPNPGWICKYCPFYARCLRDSYFEDDSSEDADEEADSVL